MNINPYTVILLALAAAVVVWLPLTAAARLARAVRAARQARRTTADTNTGTESGKLVMLAFVALAAAQSYRGLHTFAVRLLHLPPVWATLWPAMVDAAAMAFAAWAIRGARDNVPTTGARSLVAGLVAASVAMNWAQAADRHENLLAQVVSAAVAVLAFGGFEVALSATRYRALREVNAVRAPMPRFPLLLWVRYPRLTLRAWSLALRRGISDIDAAIAAAELPHLRLVAWLRYPHRAFAAQSARLAAEISAVYPDTAPAHAAADRSAPRARATSKVRTTATASGSKSRARADFARWGAGKQAAYARWAADRAAGVNTDTATLAEVGGVAASRVRHWRGEFTARYRTEPPAAPDQPSEQSSEQHTATTTVPMAKHSDPGPRESAA